MGTIKPKGRRLRLSQRPGPALRCKDAVSRAEVDLETMKAGDYSSGRLAKGIARSLNPISAGFSVRSPGGGSLINVSPAFSAGGRKFTSSP